MRNILMTVMLLAVVALIFVNIVNGDDGLRSQIEDQGESAITRIENLSP